MELGQTYAVGVDSVVDGSVVTWDGRVVNFKSLVQRRWGWPKKAAHAAAEWIKEQAKARGVPAVLWVTNPRRREQQDEVFRALPMLLVDLCSGLARGSSKEAEDADHEIREVHVVFDQLVSDDGMVREIVHVLANKFGATANDVRAVCRFDTGTPVVTLRVAASQFDGAVSRGLS